MLIKSLAIVLLATFVVAEIPSYMKVCGRRNPNLDKCVIDAVESLRDKLREGIPELDVPPLEPLELSDLPLSNTATFKAHAKNVKLYGLSNFEIISFHDDLEKHELVIETRYKKVDLDADYDINAKIVVPIVGKGPIHIESEDIHSSVVMKYKLVKKNGVDYMFFSSMTTKMSIKDYKAIFKPTDDPTGSLAVAVNAALDGARQEILESFRPILEKVASEKVLEISNKITQHFTYDELHPDTE